MEEQEKVQSANQVVQEVNNEQQVKGEQHVNNGQNVQEKPTEKKKSNNGLLIGLGLGCLFILVILFVCGVLFALFGATFTAINPSEAFSDARNTKRQQDVDALTAGLRQYILRDLYEDFSQITSPENCNITQGLAVIDPSDGIAPNEGLPVATLSVCLSDYIAGLPEPVQGSSYRWGVDNVTNPTVVIVGVDSMEAVDGVAVADYYSTIELYSYDY
jgi:hypothetical protein